MSVLKRYLVWRTAIVNQFKEVRAHVDLSEKEVLEISDGIQWNTASLVVQTGPSVEED